MKRSRLIRTGMHVLIGAGFLTILSASECDYVPTCSDACHKLARCENAWLVEEGEREMSDKAFDRFVNECKSDCGQGSDVQDDIDCISEASCDQLAEGDCI